MMFTVLAIDDSREMLASLAAKLRLEDLRVLTASDPVEGLRLALEERPDLVLLDVSMPAQNGFEVCRSLKADPRTAAIPVIFLTAAGDIGTKVHCFELGAVDYLTKPFHSDELRARVRVTIRVRRELELLRQAASVDRTTGLLNRWALDEHLAFVMESSKRGEAEHCLVLVDLDHFKQINDRFGHSVGDSVLRAVGRALARNVRASDIACRYGGEELAILIPDTTEVVGLETAERIRAKIRSLAMESGTENVFVTASFGVADTVALRAAHRSMDAQALIVAADEALYEAKRAGRDCVRAFSALQRRESGRPTTVRALGSLMAAVDREVRRTS